MSTPTAPQRTRPRVTRRGVLAAIAAVVALPPSAAAGAPPADPRELLARASEVVAEERALVAVAGVVADSAHQLDAARAELAEVDAAGAALLDTLRAAGVAVTADAEAALAPLPAAPDGMADLGGAPADSVYRTALADLLAHPAQSPAPTAVAAASRGSGLAMLVVVALMFVALGLTALLFSLRSARPRRELSALAWSDSLTGLANRRRLDHDLRDLTSAQRSSRGRHPVAGPTAVIMVDIDHFKRINDTHGHRFGDDVLREVSAMLRREVRRGDVVYRYGGEEFCIVLPGASDRDAARVAERVVAAARGLELPRGVRLTLSAGVADGTGVAVERTLHAADKALLTAKRSGRNRIAGTPAGLAGVP